MWNLDSRLQFLGCVQDLIARPNVLAMKEISQHVHGISCLSHCIFVAYVSFLLCKRWNLDFIAAARGGLLHDMYLTDWKTTDVGPFERLVIHPAMALFNASREFELSDLEKDIILTHMWPITAPLPKHKEAMVVSLADKVCTVAEVLRIYKLVKVRDQLEAFLHQRELSPGFARAQ